MKPDFLSRLRSSPDIYLQKIDLTREAGLLIQFDARSYQSASFLDDRVLGPQIQGAWAPLQHIAERVQDAEYSRPLHFIFHAGHVGSTLLSRLLDESRLVLSLREPLPLRTLAEAYDLRGNVESLLSEEQLGSLRRMLLRIWSRAYEGTHAVVLKATSSASRIGPVLLTDASAARCVHLSVKPEVYLATLLAGRNSAGDLRGHGPVRIRGLQRRIDTALRPLHALSPGELAAMSWLAEAFNAADMISAAPGRVLLLDFDDFLANVESALERVLGHFALPRTAGLSAALASSPVLTRYSKAAEFEYSPQLRLQVLDQSRTANAPEIRKGLSWLETLARTEASVAQVFNASHAPIT